MTPEMINLLIYGGCVLAGLLLPKLGINLPSPAPGPKPSPVPSPVPAVDVAALIEQLLKQLLPQILPRVAPNLPALPFSVDTGAHTVSVGPDGIQILPKK